MKYLYVIAIAVFACTPQAKAQQHTYANPIDIDYRYNFEQMQDGISYRTGADPAVVTHDGAYYLFETLADGYWRSTDLMTWTFITPSRWPMQSIVAPAVISDGNRIIIMPSAMRPQALLQSTDPASGKLDFLTRRTPELPDSAFEGQDPGPGQIPSGPWDPGLLKDDDGKWYLYWDSSNVYPLYGIELDPAKGLNYIGHPTTLFQLHPDQHGWERFGQDHSGTLANGTPIDPYIEGAWMTKHAGKYYLQYAAPGTEYNAYANGTYVGDSALGPFTYADYNPIAYKPGGFVEGAGHGSTFADRYGNYWNTGTPWIAVNWTFERRIDLLPARFYPDGQMAVDARFGDFPHYAPTEKVDDPESLFTGWMLLSYRKPAVASSTLAGDFAAGHVTDENPKTFWVAAQNAPGETLTVDLGRADTLRAVQVDFADYRSGRYGDAPDIYTEFELQSSLDGKTWASLARTEDDPRRDRPNAYFELPQPVRARFVRYVHGHVGGATLAISDLRVFGKADGPAAAMPAGVIAVRDADPREAHIAWRPVAGAVGYNVLWGVRPDRLTLCYQLFAEDAADRQHGNRLDLRALNAGVGYYVAVEAFNESGVSKRSAAIRLR